jgi:hypothetical protein
MVVLPCLESKHWPKWRSENEWRPVRFWMRANQRPLNQKEAALSGGLARDLWRGAWAGL